jgi:hypothetical protein
MINFFRKIRKKMADDNRPLKYIRYAIGEIVLVVIGILIALQVNNWNENRKQKVRFTGLLVQIYNAIYIDTQWQLTNREDIIAQYQYIDTLLTNPLKLDQKKIIDILYYVDLEPNKNKSKTSALFQNLDFNSNDKEQNELMKQLVAYGGDMFDLEADNTFSKSNSITVLLQNENIPQPNLTFGFSSFHNFTNIDTTFYNNEEIEYVQSIINSKPVIATLKTLVSKKSNYVFSIDNTIVENLNYLKLIKSYNPAISLTFNDISIIGNALETGWAKSIPMKRNDTHENVWEITTQVNDGYLKFRNGDGWAYNWGGKTFPKGNTIFYGEDIHVKKGTYHILIDLDKNSYDFTLIEN